jgi:hypothetical protein
MEPLTAVLAIVAVFLVLSVLVARADGLAFMAPKSTRGIQLSAASFCTDRCRVEGRCPMTGTTEQAGACPLWAYVRADVPTIAYGSPFEKHGAGV